ncbi:MAG: transposase [Selenomonadaceae bacterium]|nr:transposase [Selenomonadaceae bacterium]
MSRLPFLSEFQHCIIHQLIHTLKYVATKERKNFAADLKKIYTAQDEPTTARIHEEVELNWSKKYPHSMKSWRTNLDAIIPIFKFSPTLPTIIGV